MSDGNDLSTGQEEKVSVSITVLLVKLVAH